MSYYGPATCGRCFKRIERRERRAVVAYDEATWHHQGFASKHTSFFVCGPCIDESQIADWGTAKQQERADADKLPAANRARRALDAALEATEKGE